MPLHCNRPPGAGNKPVPEAVRNRTAGPGEAVQAFCDLLDATAVRDWRAATRARQRLRLAGWSVMPTSGGSGVGR